MKSNDSYLFILVMFGLVGFWAFSIIYGVDQMNVDPEWKAHLEHCKNPNTVCEPPGITSYAYYAFKHLIS